VTHVTERQWMNITAAYLTVALQPLCKTISASLKFVHDTDDDDDDNDLKMHYQIMFDMSTIFHPNMKCIF